MELSSKVFKAYYVWPRFPSISISGHACALSCKHCEGIYLKDMLDGSDPEKFVELCARLKGKGAVGILISGGCYGDGRIINLEKFLPYIRKVKEETDLIIKLHTGLVDKKLAEGIASVGIDIASLEVVGSNRAIRKVFNLNREVKDYLETVENLIDAGVKHVVPHICIGLEEGVLNGEINALNLIKKIFDPEIVVFIVLRPTRGTHFESVPIPKPEDVSKVIKYARSKFGRAELSLGCMRPRGRGREEIEIASLEAGVTRMEIPSKSTLDLAVKRGYVIKRIDACCALPKEYEKLVTKS